MEVVCSESTHLLKDSITIPRKHFLLSDCANHRSEISDGTIHFYSGIRSRNPFIDRILVISALSRAPKVFNPSKTLVHIILVGILEMVELH